MDVDFWTARGHRHISAAKSGRFRNPGGMQEGEGGDEVRAWFPCPFCYLEIEVPVLCAHLQDEHCFDLKNAVCPICAANLGRDALGHFTTQHTHSIKRRRKSQKSSVWSNTSANMIRDLRESSSFLGSNAPTGQGSGNEPASDPILSPFLCTAPTEDSQANTLVPSIAKSGDESYKVSASTSAGTDGQEHEERRQRATFLRELLLSTCF